MFSRRNLSLLVLLSLFHVGHCAKTVLTPAQRAARQQLQRQLQANNGDKDNNVDKDNNGDKDDNDKDDGGNTKDNANDKAAGDVTMESPVPPPTLQPTPLPTMPPTLQQTTPLPTMPPTPLTTTSVATPAPSTVPPTNPSSTVAIITRPPTTLGPTTTTTTNLTTTTLLSAEELREVQYFGGAEVTVRVSLWFQDGTSATQVMGTHVEEAVLQSLHSLLCQSETPLADAMNSESLGFSALFAEDTTTNNNDMDQEDRQLCVVNTDLHSNYLFPSDSAVEGSILYQPPTTIVIDGTHADTNLKWTTWTVTWDMLRLGTFYILQGLENAGDDASTMTTEQMYLAGIRAMQGIVELALQVSIRELNFDKLMVASMMGVAGQEEGSLVLTSVYGEEIETFQPKLEWLGLAQATGSPDSTQQGGQGADTNIVDPSDIVYTSTTSDVQVVETADDEEDDDNVDDRYSLEYGITETLDPPFWHALRIVGMVMFILTTASLVGLSCMSKKRQARREIERKMAKEGLLNNPQGVEDMLRASVSKRHPTDVTPELATKTYTKSEDEEGFAIPMPRNLHMH
jgi:hypothetical protein